jgi:EmrB/QacA subfamily drug resistance transporter
LIGASNPDLLRRGTPNSILVWQEPLIVILAKTAPCNEGIIRSVGFVSPCTARQKSWVIIATTLGSAMAFIDGSVVNVALPAIEKDLATSVTVIQWVVNAYELCLAALLLIGGAAGDQFGRRRLFVIGIISFAAASLWCGLAPNATQLILARAFQGVGAACLIPCSLAIIGAVFSETERGQAIGTWAGFSAIAAAIGPLLGGWIVDHSIWRVIFLINPLLAIATIWITLRHVPETWDSQAVRGLDWRGALLALAGLGSFVFGLIALPVSGWRDLGVAGSLLIGSMLLVAFVREEARSPDPMMPLELFRSRTFTGVNLLTLLLYAALGGAFFFLPFDLIQVHGYSATMAGAAFLPLTIVMAVLSRWSGGLLDRVGARLPLIVGPTIAAVGFGLLALPGPEGSYWTTFLLPITILGLGMAVSVAPLTATVLNAVPAHRAGVASGVNNAVASVASLLAVALFGAIAISEFDRALDRNLSATTPTSEVRRLIENAHGKFVIEPTTAGVAAADRQVAEAIIKTSLAQSIRVAMLVAALLALAAAVCAALTIRAVPARSGEYRARSP